MNDILEQKSDNKIKARLDSKVKKMKLKEYDIKQYRHIPNKHTKNQRKLFEIK